jgi:hypothetical protein
MERVNLQILVTTPHRNPDGIAAVREGLAKLGIQPTSSGAASLSAVVDRVQFESLFGPYPSGNALTAAPLRVPPALSNLVESITIAPRHDYTK